MSEVFRLPAPDAAVFKLNLGLETAIWSPVSDNVSSVQSVDPRDELERELLEARVLASVVFSDGVEVDSGMRLWVSVLSGSVS